MVNGQDKLVQGGEGERGGGKRRGLRACMGGRGRGRAAAGGGGGGGGGEETWSSRMYGK